MDPFLGGITAATTSAGDFGPRSARVCRLGAAGVAGSASSGSTSLTSRRIVRVEVDVNVFLKGELAPAFCRDSLLTR